MWTIKYRSRFGVDHLVVEADTYEQAEECFILHHIEYETFGVILSITPGTDVGSPAPTA